MKIIKSTHIAVFLIICSMLVFTGNQAASGKSESLVTQAGTEEAISGRLSTIWGDRPGFNGSQESRYYLKDDDGHAIRLEISAALLASLGGISAIDRKQVSVTGIWLNDVNTDASNAAPGLLPHFEAAAMEVNPQADELSAAAVTGNQKFITILCRFADSTDTTPYPKEWFETELGASYPGVDHYWREVSYYTIDLTGSVTVGWYDLPKNRADYFNGTEANLDL